MSTTINGATGIDRFGNTVIAGHQIGYESSYSGEVASASSIPVTADDTIPQITEGAQFFTLTITPKQIGSKLLLRADLNYQLAVDVGCVLAIFKSDVSDALAISVNQPRATAIANMQCVGEFTTTSLSPITFTVRAMVVGDNATLTVNGVTSARLYGGTFRSGLSATEIAQ